MFVLLVVNIDQSVEPSAIAIATRLVWRKVCEVIPHPGGFRYVLGRWYLFVMHGRVLHILECRFQACWLDLFVALFGLRARP